MALYTKFRCTACGHTKIYQLGASMVEVSELTTANEFKAMGDLEADVLSGKYGDYLAKICAVDPKKIAYDANECLLWCWKCKTIKKGRRKRLSALSWDSPDDKIDINAIHRRPYDMDIKINQFCEECDEILSEVGGRGSVTAKCPKCGEIAFIMGESMRD